MAAFVFNMSALSSSLVSVKVGQKSSFVGSVNRLNVATPRLMVASRPLKIEMAKREDELDEIRKMTTEEIQTSVEDLKGELFLLRCKKEARQELKTSEFRRIRKRVARMLTVRRERELEQGIKPRESRKIKRAWIKNIVPRPPPSYKPEVAK